MRTTAKYSEIVDPSQSALLSFKSENVLSYRDKEHFSMHAGSHAKQSAARELPTASGKHVEVLPVAGIFGANASGKTTFLRAMKDMRSVILKSFKDEVVFRRPFLLDKESAQQPSCFEVNLLISGVYWRYGFTIDDNDVLSEHAYYYPKGRRVTIFERNEEEISFGSSLRPTSNYFHKLLRNNILLLSVAGALRETIILPLYSWFENNLQLADSLNRGMRGYHTSHLIEDPSTKKYILNLIRAADLGVADIKQVDEASKRIDDPFEEPYRLTHSSPWGEFEFESFDESLGTKVWIGLVGKIHDSLLDGTVLLVDELDASLHPSLVRHTVDIFQSGHKNPYCAQLIFNSHDYNLFEDIELHGLGPDQIWLTKKTHEGVSSIYPLTDFSLPKDTDIRKDYLVGRYGGVPDLDHANFDLEIHSADL